MPIADSHRAHRGFFILSFTHDGRWLISAGYDGDVRLWDPATGLESHRIADALDLPFDVAIGPDGIFVVINRSNGSLRYLDLESGRELPSTGETGPVLGIGFDSDGRPITSQADGIWTFRDLDTGRALRTLDPRSAPLSGFAISPDGSLVASDGTDHTIKLWDPAGGRALGTFAGHWKSVISIDFSPDGELLASGSFGGTIWCGEFRGKDQDGWGGTRGQGKGDGDSGGIAGRWPASVGLAGG